MEDWIKDCEPLDFVNIDVHFCINEAFYYGPSDVESIAAQKQTSPLPSVTNKAAAVMNYRTLKAEQNTEKLLAYYEEVLRLAKNYGKKDTEISHYFWLKLSLWRPDLGLFMNFPWYDSLDEVAPILEKIASDEDGVLLSDEDQGWEAEIVAKDGFIYVREEDTDTGEIFIQHQIPRGPLAAECRDVLERSRALVAWLSDCVGEDWWTRTKYPADLVS